MEAPPSSPPFKESVLTFLAAALIRAIACTLRIRVEGREHLDAAIRAGRPAVLIFWHEDLIGMMVLKLRAWPTPALIMISRSRDGERLARVVQRLGMEAVRASSSRGGVAGLVELKRRLIQPVTKTSRRIGPGRVAAMALDGPRGPRRVAKPGAITLARHAQALVLPIAFHHSRAKVFRSWDRTRLPLPFARTTIAFGPLREPDYYLRSIEPPGIETEANALDISARLAAEVNVLHEAYEAHGGAI